MTAEQIAAALLDKPAIKALAGQISLAELPQGTEYPAIVYEAISSNPLEFFCNHGKNQTARIQINPIANSLVKVNQIHQVIKTEIVNFSAQNIAGARLVSCTFYGYGPASKDEQNMWTKPGDYRIIFEA